MKEGICTSLCQMTCFHAGKDQVCNIPYVLVGKIVGYCVGDHVGLKVGSPVCVERNRCKMSSFAFI